jgi:electron transfer flavoprotein beta subunit
MEGVLEIFVLMKRVPDTESQIEITEDKNSIELGDLNYIINPYDEYAIEAALQIKENSEATVTLLTVGEDGSQATIRKGLAMGADKAVFLHVEKDLLDPRQTAHVLHAYLADKQVDLILGGKQGVDYDNGSTAVMLATMLGLPSISSICSLESSGSSLKLGRETENGLEIYEIEMPCLLTADKGLNEPRYASLKGIMMAKRKPLETVECAVDKSAKFAVEEISYPESRPAGRIIGEGAAAVPELLKLLKDEAKVL